MSTRATGPADAAAARVPFGESQPRSEGGGSAAAGDPFDAWLHRHLHRSYDATLAEPIPAELLRLIDEGGKA